MTTTIAAKPHLCSSTWLLFCRSTRGFDHHVVAVGFAMALDGSKEGGPKMKPISFGIIKEGLILLVLTYQGMFLQVGEAIA